MPLLCLESFNVFKNAGTQRKIPASKTHICDSLSPYVGITQIRFWVKASAYSQPAYASTPLFITILLYTLVFKIQVLIPLKSKTALNKHIII